MPDSPLPVYFFLPPPTCLAHNNTPLLTVAHVDHASFVIDLYSISQISLFRGLQTIADVQRVAVNILSILLLSDKKKCRQS